LIPVTKPFLPPIEEYSKLVAQIWDSEHLTNNGPLVQKLEKNLTDYLDVPNILYVNNGTIAIQIAIKALGLKGEIITTPFSYVATTSSIVWENCTPVFVDIDKNSFNIDPTLIEESITERTTGILATHVFGNPCEIDVIKAIADKHNLKVIYDAAHCFGTKYNGTSVFKFGDISTTSFHATKLFQTIEGGAIFTANSELQERMWYMRNFGHNGQEQYNGVGINGKNSEFHAAMGLCNLDLINGILVKRKQQCELYYQNLLKHDRLKFQKMNENSEWNFSYFSLVFPTENICEHVIARLQKDDIYPRRYFYPSLSSLNYVENQKTPVSDSVASRILCLPLFHSLSNTEITEICETIIKVINE